MVCHVGEKFVSASFSNGSGFSLFSSHLAFFAFLCVPLRVLLWKQFLRLCISRRFPKNEANPITAICVVQDSVIDCFDCSCLPNMPIQGILLSLVDQKMSTVFMH